ESHGNLIQQVCLDHFVVQVTAFTAPLAYAHEHRVGAQALVYIMDEFLDQNGFAYAGTAQQTHFEALPHGGEEVQHLDAGPEDIPVDFDFVHAQVSFVDTPGVHLFQLGPVDGLTIAVEHMAQN